MGSPRLSKTYLDALRLSFEKRGLIALVPWLFIVTVILPLCTGTQIFEVLALGQNNQSLIPVFSGLLVCGGFFCATSINLMSQVISILSNQQISDHLKKIGAFDQFIFWPQFTLLIQISFLMLNIVTIFSYITAPDSIFSQRLVFGALGFLIYTGLKTWNLVDLVRVLVWHRSQILVVKD